MGGLSLLHYAHFGFRLVSIEYYLVPGIREALQTALPTLTMFDGDGTSLVPNAVQSILRSDPMAKIAVILDGPKDKAAVRVSKEIISKVALVVLDDQAYEPPKKRRTSACLAPGISARVLTPTPPRAAIPRPAEPEGASSSHLSPSPARPATRRSDTSGGFTWFLGTVFSRLNWGGAL